MSLDISLNAMRETEVFSRNVTHNLTPMAVEAGLYDLIWCADERDEPKASEFIKPLQDGLNSLINDPARFKAFNPPNGWGSYEGFLEFVTELLVACIENPDAKITVWR